MIGANALLETLGLRKRWSEVLSVDCIDFTPSITPVVETSLWLLIWNHLCEMHNGSQFSLPLPNGGLKLKLLRHPNLNMSDTSPEVQYSALFYFAHLAMRCNTDTLCGIGSCSYPQAWGTKGPRTLVLYSILGCHNVGSPIIHLWSADGSDGLWKPILVILGLAYHWLYHINIDFFFHQTTVCCFLVDCAGRACHRSKLHHWMTSRRTVYSIQYTVYSICKWYVYSNIGTWEN